MDKKELNRDRLRELSTIDLGKRYKPPDKSFYESPEWRELKKFYMNQHPLCELCLNEGAEKLSRELHHIKPISVGGKPLDESNLIALCKLCHGSIHGGMRWFIDFSSPDIKLPWDKALESVQVDGVRDNNPDGTDRQSILAQCKKGEPLRLVRYPDHPDGIRVFRESGELIGHVENWIQVYCYLRHDMDRGHEFRAKVLEITGTPGNYECFIEIERTTSDDLDLWDDCRYCKWYENGICRKLEVNITNPAAQGLACGDFRQPDVRKKITGKNEQARELVKKAQAKEQSKLDEAVSLYRDAIGILREIDADGGINMERWTRYPINRLTLVLERSKRYELCLEEIEEYEQIDDTLGLTKSDTESLFKRKARILKKLS